MRTIGMLLGIPEADQEAIRDQLDENLRLEEDGETVVPRAATSTSPCSRSTSSGGRSIPPTT